MTKMLPNLNKQGIKEFVVETNQMGRLLARLQSITGTNQTKTSR